MAGKAAKSSIPTPSANKDLSCLRCRKKKAKCSKTRPTCTRCSRSNQPCEYPDAPPNLTDLSQKVLTLYDTLRELEGEFLVKYMQTDEDEHIKLEPVEEPIMMEPIKIETEEPTGWSMSLTPTGLSIHAVTRNFTEFNEFAKTISRQAMRDFGPAYLPSSWDPDAEGYFQEDSDTEELDEDEYLVTVPVFSTSSLLHQTTEEVDKVSYVETEIESQIPGMLRHLTSQYECLETCDTSHHVVMLLQLLRPYLPSDSEGIDSLSRICVLTGYAISTKEFHSKELDMKRWEPCAEYARVLFMEELLKGEIEWGFPVVICGILLGWIGAETRRNDKLILMSMRVLCGSDRKEGERWDVLMASLVYLDVYSATFGFKRAQMSDEITKNAMGKEASFRTSVILLEGKLMWLLNKVVRLFYQVEETQGETRKIDVDEVLTLVRDIEIWEQDLPEWAKWNAETETIRTRSKLHMHMIHNTVKILLFHMSMSSADRLVSCIVYLKKAGFWIKSAKDLILDVSERVLRMFDNDQAIVDQLEKIQSRLIYEDSQIKKGKNSN
ncbi:uncharacterized protein EV154DRAFT_43567 [Mucor mucedo]|uniref:uncharacterized protein n=1 Tax=Mucor mucedo TaxID=29922 RepID=UPI00221EABB4|nr:uncharacterized protein EV154DRAFT_43567 [Mucor mucedo]KAI7881240.1 hypothetical protein EV154DRAFT_43567 [Mucor mucedo]